MLRLFRAHSEFAVNVTYPLWPLLSHTQPLGVAVAMEAWLELGQVGLVE